MNDNLLAHAYDTRGRNVYGFDKSVSRQSDGAVHESATFTYTATDADGNTDELTFAIVVTASAITFDSGMANQSWTVGTAVSVTTPTLSGGVGAFTYSITPALPAGVTFTAGNAVTLWHTDGSDGFCDLYLYRYRCGRYSIVKNLYDSCRSSSVGSDNGCPHIRQQPNGYS